MGDGDRDCASRRGSWGGRDRGRDHLSLGDTGLDSGIRGAIGEGCRGTRHGHDAHRGGGLVGCTHKCHAEGFWFLDWLGVFTGECDWLGRQK